MKVICLHGGPGTGKTTTAWGLGFAMKKLGINVEYSAEYVKDKVYEKHYMVFGNQEKIFAEQNWRLSRLIDSGIDYAITDCPLITTLLYGGDGTTFGKLVLEKFDSYDNYNYVLTRDHAFNPVGRIQKTNDECVEIDERLIDFLGRHAIPYTVLPASDEAIRAILVEHGFPGNAVELP
jgi:hypothetical protein